MKKIALLLLILIAGLTAFGTAIVTYANNKDIGVAKNLVSERPVSSPTVKPTQPGTQDAQPAPTGTPTLKPLISQGSSAKPEIALTFDDGPNPTYTPQVLSILHQYSVNATFFVIGEQVQAYPNLVQQEHAAGHIVGNHSWNHPYLTTLAADDIHTQLSNTSNAIEQATGVRPSFFRPPYGAYNYQVLLQASNLGLQPILWSVDPQDWNGPPSSNTIVQRVLAEARNGSIILMHDGGGNRSQTVAALPTIITQLRSRGYQLVTVQQLVNHASQANTGQSSPLTSITGAAIGSMAGEVNIHRRVPGLI
jgi:peptidoglycan/xylan/chitin deacetylase (PgdA/CDA1 family)